MWRRILESRDRVPGGQTLRGKQHSEQSAPISSRVVTCLHPPEGGRKLPSMLLKTVCQAAKISDKLFLLQISWFQPRLHSLHLPAGPCSCNSTAHFLLRITERYFSSLPITPNLATQGSGPPSWKFTVHLQHATHDSKHSLQRRLSAPHHDPMRPLCCYHPFLRGKSGGSERPGNQTVITQQPQSGRGMSDLEMQGLDPTALAFLAPGACMLPTHPTAQVLSRGRV